MPRIYEQMGIALDNNKRMLMHRLSLGDTVMGFFGGFLIWGDYLHVLGGRADWADILDRWDLA